MWLSLLLKVHAIGDNIDDKYGIIASTRFGRKELYFPLCELEALDLSDAEKMSYRIMQYGLLISKIEWERRNMVKLGTNKKPAVVRVATEERANEIYNLCENQGWQVIIGIEPDKPEDISDVQKLMGVKLENTKTIVKELHIGRNEPCPCGSGKKYKKCCG